MSKMGIIIMFLVVTVEYIKVLKVRYESNVINVITGKRKEFKEFVFCFFFFFFFFFFVFFFFAQLKVPIFLG